MQLRSEQQAADAQAATPPTIEFDHVLTSFRSWWRMSVVATVDQLAVIGRRRADCGMSARYVFMLAMSAGIAVLGLLLSSPAVVIGAMLLSPLMGPIIGLGFALAIGDFAWLRESFRSLVWGTLVSVVLCTFIVLLSPLQTVTPEIAARTRPNLFDLAIALFSALAGAYAMIRGREGTIVGVAIATALMPPLAVVGFGIATWNWTVFSGAAMLYVTNLLTIALTAAVMARIYGFGSTLSPRQTQLQTVGIVLTFLVLAVPLGLSLRQIAWESNASRTINSAVREEFGPQARISQMDIDFDARPIAIVASVLTPKILPGAESHGARALDRQLGRPVMLTVQQYKVGTGEGDVEAAQLAAARAQEQAADARAVEEMTARLALVAGVADDAVLVDPQTRRAVVNAQPLDGATLTAYRTLESRVAAAAPGWTLQLRPPAGPLPDITLANGTPDEAGTRSLALIAWAGQRVDAPIRLAGPEEAVAAVASALAKHGVRTLAATGPAGRITARWATPDARQTENAR